MILLLAVEARCQVSNRRHHVGTEGESIPDRPLAPLQVVSVISQLFKYTVDVTLVLADHIAIPRTEIAAFSVTSRHTPLPRLHLLQVLQ